MKNNILIYDNNYYYTLILLDKFNTLWTNDKVIYIIKLVDNYINLKCSLIEQFMNKIDNNVINIILENNY